jgi:hypothetical protein
LFVYWSLEPAGGKQTGEIVDVKNTGDSIVKMAMSLYYVECERNIISHPIPTGFKNVLATHQSPGIESFVTGHPTDFLRHLGVTRWLEDVHAQLHGQSRNVPRWHTKKHKDISWIYKFNQYAHNEWIIILLGHAMSGCQNVCGAHQRPTAELTAIILERYLLKEKEQ